MKLYTTPPSILTLVTWIPQSKLAFGQTPHIGWPSGLQPSVRPYADSSKLSYSTVVVNISSCRADPPPLKLHP